jgi:tetratricopeptide (TPR) repeat protein
MLTLLLFFFWADPVSFESLLRSGLLALNQNQLATARTQLEAASRLKPKSAEVWLALAQTYRKLKRDPASQAAIRKAEALAGNNAVALQALAYFHREGGNYAKAASFEARYAELTPRDSEAAARAVDLYLRAQKPELAIELANKALQKEDRAGLRFLLGKAYEMQKEPAKAAEQMRRAAALNPYEEDYYFQAARQYAIAGNSPAAIEVIQAGKKVFAKSPQLELMLGVAYYAIQQYPQAMDAFLRTISLDPTVEQPYVFIARTMDHAPSRMPEILEAFKVLAEKAPDNYLSNYLYGKALLMSGDDDEKAEALLRKSVSLNDRYWESRQELGRALEQAGDLEAAVPELRKAIELNPKSSTAHFLLGRVYDRMGKPAEAKAEYAIQARIIDEEESGPFRYSDAMKQLKDQKQ